MATLSRNLHLLKALLAESATRRITFGIAGDSNITRSGYGYAKGIPFALFDSNSYTNYASGLMNGNFTGSLDPSWATVTSNGVNISEGDATDEANSGIISAESEMNGPAWSVADGVTEGDSGNNLIHSAAWNSQPDWFSDWTGTDFHFHYSFATPSVGDEAIQLQIRRGTIKMTGDAETSTSGTLTYGLMAGDAGDIDNGVSNQRIEVEIKGATGLVAINNICVEYANRTNGIQTTILNQESGGEADDWKTRTAANSTFLAEQIKRIGTIQGESAPIMCVFIHYGSNEYGGGDANGYAQDILDAIDDYDTAWLANGYAIGDLSYCITGSPPRTDPDFAFRTKQVELAASYPSRISTYQPTDTWPTVSDFTAAWYDGGSESAHLVAAGYLAVAEDMVSRVVSASSPTVRAGRNFRARAGGVRG